MARPDLSGLPPRAAAMPPTPPPPLVLPPSPAAPPPSFGALGGLSPPAASCSVGGAGAFLASPDVPPGVPHGAALARVVPPADPADPGSSCGCGGPLGAWALSCDACGLLREGVPPAWGRGEHTRTVELPPHSAEALAAASSFRGAPGLEVRAVYRVEALPLLEGLQLRQRQLARRGAPRSGAEWLWHGAPPDVVAKIVCTGFDRGFSARARLGRGVYFARDAAYSAGAAFAVPTPAGERLLVRALVCPGFVTHDVDPSGAAPPARSPDALFDSVEDPVARILAVFHDHAAYPAYVLRVGPVSFRLGAARSPVAVSGARARRRALLFRRGAVAEERWARARARTRVWGLRARRRERGL